MPIAIFLLFLSAAFAQPKDLASSKIEKDSLETIEQDFAKAEQKEEKIPVLKDVPKAKAESQNPFLRMLMALGVIAALGGGTILYAKKFKKNKTTSATSPKIQVLNQHYLGPKKSLAIVKIAGESILIGITDHNITPIRVLSLLDDELPPQAPSDFNAAMDNIDFLDEIQDEFTYSSLGLRE